MEGIIYLHRGLMKGYKKYYAKVEEQDRTFTLLRKSYKGTTFFKITLDRESKVIPSESEITNFTFYNDGKKYRFRTESPFKRLQWLQLINQFTQNLSDDLRSFSIDSTYTHLNNTVDDQLLAIHQLQNKILSEVQKLRKPEIEAMVKNQTVKIT